MRQKIIVAIDSGSGAIKFGFAKLDLDTGEMESIDYTADQSVKIKLAEDLETNALLKEIQKTGYVQDVYDIDNQPLNICQEFSPYASSASLDATKVQNENRFSTEVKEKYLQYIAKVVDEIREIYPNQEIQVHLVGTAALRQADDSKYLIEALERRLTKAKGVKTNIKVISQKDEGIYAFEGAVAKEGLDKDRVITWDIGGGSMQLTGTDGDDHQVLGGTTASSTFKTQVLELLGKEDESSIYPIAKKDVAKVVELAVKQVSFDAAQEEWMQRKRSESDEIIGAGNIHDSLLRLMKHNEIVGSAEKSYNKEDLDKLINLFADKTAEQIDLLLSDRDKAFSENILTNMLLVRATMEKYDISTVKVIEVSNTDSILQKAVDLNLSSVHLANLPSNLPNPNLQIAYGDGRGGPENQPVGNWQGWLQNANIGLKLLQYFWPGKFGQKESAPIHIELDPRIAELREQEERKKRYTYIDLEGVAGASKELKKYVQLEGSERHTPEYIKFDGSERYSQPATRDSKSGKRVL